MDERLEALRAQIDEADALLVRALAARWRAVLAIAEHKRERRLDRFDPARELLVRERWRAEGRALGLPEALVDAVFDAVIERSRAEVTAR